MFRLHFKCFTVFASLIIRVQITTAHYVGIPFSFGTKISAFCLCVTRKLKSPDTIQLDWPLLQKELLRYNSSDSFTAMSPKKSSIIPSESRNKNANFVRPNEGIVTFYYSQESLRIILSAPTLVGKSSSSFNQKLFGKFIYGAECLQIMNIFID